MISSITGVADCWKPSCQSDGWPSPAQARPAPAKRAPTVTATAVNRLNTSIAVVAPSMRPSCPPRPEDNGRNAAWAQRPPWASPRQACGGTKGESQSLKPQFRPPRNAPRHGPVRQSAGCPARPRSRWLYPPHLGHNGVFKRPLTGPPGHGPQRGLARGLSGVIRRTVWRWGGFRQVEATMGSIGPDLLRRAAMPVVAAAALTFSALAGMPDHAAAQGAVRSVHDDWQIRCDTPPGAQAEQCALIQSVTAADRANVGLTVIVLKTADQKSKLLRVLAPMGVLLPSGLGLKIDQVDVGRAGFVRCLPNGCVAEVIMDENLIKQLRTGQTATFIIFQTPEEGIGFPMSLKGFGEGYDKLP